jgi:hypothetical protein
MFQSRAVSEALQAVVDDTMRRVPSFATHPWIKEVSPP